MCDSCSDFQLLLLRIERSAETTNSDNEGEGEIELTGQDVNISLNFINTWHQKQCMCIFRDVKNIGRFSTLVQTITKLALVRLKQLPALLLPEGGGEVEPRPPDPVQGYIEEAEILVTYLSRMFMLQFPLYLAAKQAGSRLEDLNHAEATSLAVFLDVAGDIADIPLVLLQNVAKFCRTGGLLAMTNILNLPPAVLPHSFAHGLVSILCNLKLWLNPRALSQLFSPVRAAALQYLCKLSDLELRQQHSRAMADFLWSCNKDNIDSPPGLDKEGLELAFKYFSSPTLTMRLAGINQVNAHISIYNDVCSTEAGPEVDQLGTQLADWILDSKLVDHIFGPNLHVEVIKQSHVILNFLAMEARLTNVHIEAIWQAAQLKHCSKQVHDLISPLIKNLEAGPVLHLLTLLKNLPLKEHTEQTIYLAQVVQKFIWSKGSVFPLLPDTQPGRRGSRASTGSESQRRFLQSGRRSSRDSIGSDQGHRFLQSGRRSSRDSTGSDQDRRFIENQRKRSCTESSEDMDIQELAELDDEQDELDELDDGDEFSEDDDELVSSSDPDSDSGRNPRHKPTHPDVDDDDQLDQSVDLDSPPPRSRVHLKPPSSPLDRPRGPTSRSRSPISRVSGPFRLARIKPGNKQEQQRKVSLEDEEEEDDVEDNEILEEEEEEENLENIKDSDREDDKENEEKVEKDEVEKEEDIDNKEISLKRSREPSDKISGEFEFSSEGGTPGPEPSREEPGPGPRGDPRAKKAKIVRKLSEAEQLPAPVNCSGTWGTTWDDGGQGAVMNELANLVGAGEEGRRGVERSGGRGREGGRGKDRGGGRRDRGHRLTDIYASQYIRNYRQDSRYKNEVDTSGEGSDEDEGGIQGYRDPETSSHNSGKSEKNLEDFVDEDESCEEELARLAQVEQLGSILQQQQLAQMAQLYQSRLNTERMHRKQSKEDWKQLAEYRMDKVTEPGNTLLWDLVQEGQVEQLGEGLAAEAEKSLTNLLCFNMERVIRMVFIEGCLKNLENNKSVVVSLKLIPKLIQSFHNFPGSDTHEMTMYIERTHNMSQLFFNNLKAYTRGPRRDGFYPPATEIQVRLHFLAVIFSICLSPDTFRLTLDQVSTLWECLAPDPSTSEDLFQWLLAQAHSKDQHALTLPSIRFLYTEKLPEINPVSMTMTGLNLLSQFRCMVINHQESADKQMDQVWIIALRAGNTDVSLKAIHLLNSNYLGRGQEFITTCMSYLQEATSNLDNLTGSEDQLLRIQRALLLLKSHMETFRKKYAYNFRRLALEGKSVPSHADLVSVRHSSPLRIVVQPGGSIGEKVTFDMSSSDLVSELRAEITSWWEEKVGSSLEVGSMLGSLLGGSSVIGGKAKLHLRLISQGQELHREMDERSLSDVGFKDMQLVFANIGSTNRPGLDRAELPSFPGRSQIPMLLLLESKHFDQLFSLMSKLSSLTATRKDAGVLDTRAQILSRRVWEIILLLPTNPNIMRGLQEIDPSSGFESLLDPNSAQKLLYSFYIIDWLGRPARLRRFSGLAETSSPHTGQVQSGWIKQFISAGGLKHLFSVFLSGVLGRRGDSCWSEWSLDCLGFLLRLLVQFGVDQVDADTLADQLVESTASTKKRNKWIFSRKAAQSDRMQVPTLSPVMLNLMQDRSVLVQLGEVFSDASSHARESVQYKTGQYGRSQVIHFAMALLVSWVYSADVKVDEEMFACCGMSTWLKSLLLEDPDPSVRREICTGIYRLCLGSASNGKTGLDCISPVLSILLQYLGQAQLMKPHRRESLIQPGPEEPGKEPFGPACRDYFWVLAKLVENIKETQAVDPEALVQKLIHGISTRPLYERRNGASVDDALIGMMNLLCALLKQTPSLKVSPACQQFVKKLFSFLYALPSPGDKLVPKCKSPQTRSACYDLVVELVKGCLENYKVLHTLLLQQHNPGFHKPYPWEYWPLEDGRSECGYVGLVNLGATCYMATCVQQLFMIPAIRDCVLQTDVLGAAVHPLFGKHQATLHELRRMFAYLLESERKSYNPLSFCKTYTMDNQPLNTGEQKDMAEFFIDLLSKMEEMSLQLKEVVKTTFCGTLSNNVVSLDCGHVSTTSEEFYTVRCQVSEMRNLQQSLEEVCVKDMLEGDNMYTCSQCGKKVRAEKRACFKSLPDILAFNTMRYSFNMVTMLKEKVNTHFSFPLQLDMAPYMEHTLIPKPGGKEGEENCDISVRKLEYELIGVTVHTGNADGGHYYAFIKDRTSVKDKWYSFNDAEVKAFDPNQIASECFGGEMSSRTYDQVTDKFLDLSIEKTNSAYMLFYQKINKTLLPGPSSEVCMEPPSPAKQYHINLAPELEDWILEDNRNFIQDNNIFDHTYFNFMWQMAGFIPTTLTSSASTTSSSQGGSGSDITLLSAQLATTFFLETFIHAKEKLNIVQWVELLTKQLDSSAPACCWLLNHMSVDTHWLVSIFLRCNIPTIRQMFHRLVIHVISKLRSSESSKYLLPWVKQDMDEYPDPATQMLVGLTSPVTSFVRTLLRLLESGTAKPHLKHVTELFSFLLDFTKLGDQEAEFLLTIQAITSCVEFYLKTIGGLDPEVDISDDEEEEEDIITLPLVGVDMNTSRTASLDKMITLIAVLVEKSRGPDNLIHLHPTTLNSLTCGKFPIFLYNITKENINIRQTCNLIFSLTRHNPSLAESVAEMVFLGVKNQEHSIHFFKLLTLLTELSGGPAGLPCYTTLIMCRVWDLAKACPQAALDWLSIQVTRNKHAQTWLLSSMGDWVQQYLIGHCHGKVRNSAAFLLVSLVPSLHFRQTFRTPRGSGIQIRESLESNDGIYIVHRLLDFLLSLLKTCKHYIDINIHGSNKLVSYFQVMNHLLLGKPEKLLLGKYFQDLWCLFHPKLSEPSIPVHPNKQALLQFWYTSLVDCRENIQLVLSNPQVVRNLAFNYILADHEDAEVVAFNRTMLPIYYGILRMCCAENRSFCRSLAQHQNIQWAFKNISPYSTQYTAAVDELMKLVEEFVKRYPDSTEQDIREIRLFKTQTLQLYLGILDGRSSSGTLISALRILLETAEDRVFAVCHNALALIFDAFNILHLMHHEATACHVTQEIRELLNIFLDLIRTVRSSSKSPELHAVTSRWKEMPEMTSRLVTLCNSFTPSELKETSLSCLKEMLLLWPKEMLCHMVPMFHRSHIASSESDSSMIGPFFPRRHRRSLPAKAVRPPRPMLQLTVPASQLEASHGQDPEYDKALHRYFWSFHHLVDLMVRVAVNEESVTKPLIDLSAIVGFDGVPLHFMLFPKLWLDIYNSKNIEENTLNNSINLLVESTAFMEYVDAVLLDERSCLNNQYVFQFLVIFFPKVSAQVLNDQVNHVLSSVRSLLEHARTLDLNNLQTVKGAVGDVRALQLVTGTEGFSENNLLSGLLILRDRVNRHTHTSPVKHTPGDQEASGSKHTSGDQGASGPKEHGSGDQSSSESQDEKGEKEKEKEKYPLESESMGKEKEEKAGPSKKRGNEKLVDTLQTLLSCCDSLISQLQKQEEQEEQEESTKPNQPS